MIRELKKSSVTICYLYLEAQAEMWVPCIIMIIPNHDNNHDNHDNNHDNHDNLKVSCYTQYFMQDYSLVIKFAF